MKAILTWGAKSDLRMWLVLTAMWTATAAVIAAVGVPVIVVLLGWI